MPYYVIFETMHSAGEEADTLYVSKAINEDDAKRWWQEMYSVEDDIFQSNTGNVFEYNGCKEVTKEEFKTLEKFCKRII